jgi:hypothetical protein
MKEFNEVHLAILALLDIDLKEHRERVRQLVIENGKRNPCGGHQGICVLAKGHEGACLDKNMEPARWSDPTYLGDGPWGA